VSENQPVIQEHAPQSADVTWNFLFLINAVSVTQRNIKDNVNTVKQ